MPLSKLIKKTREKITVRKNITDAEIRKVCPSGKSPHSKGWCTGNTSKSFKVTRLWGNGKETVSYEDHWKCDYCGNNYTMDYTFL